MREVRLRLRAAPGALVSAEGLTPGAVRELDASGIGRLPLLHGRDPVPVGELFEVEEGEPGEGPVRLVLEGDLSLFDHVGEGMSEGEMVVRGDVRDHSGAGMSGGRLVVEGSAGDWCGAEMTGGEIRVRSDVGDHAGAGYPGSPFGMNRGLLLVDGEAGRFAGAGMRRGLLAVRGRAGPRAGAYLLAGSLLLLGGTEGPPGAGMRRGTILLAEEPELLPGFRFACEYRPPYLTYYLRRLAEAHGFETDGRLAEGRYRRYSGDFTDLGRGEVLVWQA